MNTYIVLYSFLVLSDIIFCINISSLISIYASVCGAKYCHLNSSLALPVFGFTNDVFCPTCSCSDFCIWTRNCCPDKFFEWNWSCVDTNIIKYGVYNNDRHSISMVTKCPKNTDEHRKRNCNHIVENIEGKLTNIPVYSSISGISYRNIYCARCYHEKENDILSWRIETECQQFADFNFLSSYNAIIKKAEQSMCTFNYSAPENALSGNKCWNNVCGRKTPCADDETLITECNVTGTWVEYDPDVDLACRTYDNKYNNLFKNVFCHVCNPPQSTGIVIERCNETGLWETYTRNMEKGCNITQKTPLTFPFKNFYCYLCNSKQMNSVTELKTKAFNIHFSYESLRQSKNMHFETKIQSLQLHLKEFKLTGENILEELRNKQAETSYVLRKNFSNVTLPNVLAKYYAYTGDPYFSSNYSFSNSNSICDNTDNCYFKNSCCIEKYFERSTKCTNPIYSNFEYGYRLFDSCVRISESSLLSHMCRLDSSEHFFNFMPVETVSYKTYPPTVLHYKNIYCALCDFGDSRNTKTKLWDLQITCYVFISHFYFNSIDDYFRHLKENRCNIKYRPSDLSNVECKTENMKCNRTGSWTIYDRDIKFACENITSNVRKSFCEMCNPSAKFEITYHTCNETGDWLWYDDAINNKCIHLPEIEAMAPYKNYFCRMCNQNGSKLVPIMSLISDTYKTQKKEAVHPIGYRSFFAFSNYKPRKTEFTLGCNSSQSFFQNKCLDIVCYPGKILMDSGCKPLLQFTSKLGYIMFGSIKVATNGHINNTEEFITFIDAAFKEHVVRGMTLSSREHPFNSTYLISDKNCTQNIKGGDEITVNVYYELFFEFNVNRTNVEEVLVHSITSKFNITFENVTHFVEVYPDSSSINVPNMINKSEFTHKCHIKKPTSYPQSRYIKSRVGDLLLCEQVELFSNNFEIDKNTLVLKVLGSRIELPPDKYLLVAPNNTRICVKYFTQNTLSTPSHKLSIASVVTLICIILSLLCLFISFVTYCLFESLRTLPGKNNMCLMFAMFCSNILFLSVTQGIKSHVGCKAIGILMHYFWLATFSCLGVCSFHMYRVFSNKTVARLSKRLTLVCYAVFSFCAPAFVVILNVTITLTITGNTIGYGGNTCFLINPMAFIFSFIVPIGLTCCLNIFFFISTSLYIARRPKLKNDSKMKTNQVHYVVYIKLFAITGITWFLQIIDAFVPESAFSTIVVILNALQGFFIFLSYICNYRVFNLYQNFWKSSSDTFTIQTSSGKTSATNVSSSESSKLKISDLDDSAVKPV